MVTAFDDIPAWPEQKSESRHGIGGNNPPPDAMARDEFNAALDAALARRSLTRARFEDLIDQASRARATDDETVGRCGELVKSLRAAIKLVDDIHAETKAPYLGAGRELDALRNALKAPLDEAKRTVERKQAQYLTEQENLRLAELRRQREEDEARRRAEREAELARQAEEGIPAAPPAEPEPEVVAAPVEKPEIIRGDFGAAVSGKREWVGEVVDYEVAFVAANLAGNAKVREAIDKAVAGAIRGGAREIEGVRIYQQIKASNR